MIISLVFRFLLVQLAYFYFLIVSCPFAIEKSLYLVNYVSYGFSKLPKATIQLRPLVWIVKSVSC